MTIEHRKIKCNIIKIVKLLSVHFFFLNLQASAKSSEIFFNIFFNDKDMLIEDPSNDSLIPSYEISLNSSMNIFSSNSGSSPKSSMITIEKMEGPSYCSNVISFYKKSLKFKDPDEKLLTYTECKFNLTNKSTNKSVFIRIGLNRTFRSWCKRKERASPEIRKTVNAVLDILQAEGCKDESVKISLVNAKMLNLAHKDIVDVSPIGSFTNLRALWLNNNSISDISPLASLKNLFVLSLSNNNLSNIHTLKYLKNSRWVFLSKNHISKLQAISHLRNIKVLTVENNDIVDLKPLFELNTNTKIMADGNPIHKDICKEYLIHKEGVENYLWLDKLCKATPTNSNLAKAGDPAI